MGLKEFVTVPQDVREWGRWMRAQLGNGEVTSVSIADGAVTDAKFRPSAGLSIIGNAGAAIATPADIVASVDGQILRRSGATLGFGTITSAALSDFTEAAQDAVGAALANSATVTLAYVDATPTITAALVADSVDNTFLANMAAATIKGSVAGGDPADLSATDVASIVSAAVASALNISGGTYTPTLTNGANIAASTSFAAQWFRVGNTVVVSGALLVDPTLTVTNSELGISLPVPSNFVNNFECGGTCAALAVAGRAAGIIADPANDRARMVWLADDVTNHGRSYLFMYQVI